MNDGTTNVRNQANAKVIVYPNLTENGTRVTKATYSVSSVKEEVIQVLSRKEAIDFILRNPSLYSKPLRPLRLEPSNTINNLFKRKYLFDNRSTLKESSLLRSNKAASMDMEELMLATLNFFASSAGIKKAKRKVCRFVTLTYKNKHLPDSCERALLDIENLYNSMLKDIPDVIVIGTVESSFENFINETKQVKGSARLHIHLMVGSIEFLNLSDSEVHDEIKKYWKLGNLDVGDRQYEAGIKKGPHYRNFNIPQRTINYITKSLSNKDLMFKQLRHGLRGTLDDKRRIHSPLYFSPPGLYKQLVKPLTAEFTLSVNNLDFNICDIVASVSNSRYEELTYSYGGGKLNVLTVGYLKPVGRKPTKFSRIKAISLYNIKNDPRTIHKDKDIIKLQDRVLQPNIKVITPVLMTDPLLEITASIGKDEPIPDISHAMDIAAKKDQFSLTSMYYSIKAAIDAKMKEYIEYREQQKKQNKVPYPFSPNVSILPKPS